MILSVQEEDGEVSDNNPPPKVKSPFSLSLNSTSYEPNKTGFSAKKKSITDSEKSKSKYSINTGSINPTSSL